MAGTSEIHSENFDDSTLSALLGSVKTEAETEANTEADTGSIPTTCTTQASRQVSSIRKHTHTATEEEKAYTKKRYFCKYCPP
jgi:hypothetical protein